MAQSPSKGTHRRGASPSPGLPSGGGNDLNFGACVQRNSRVVTWPRFRAPCRGYSLSESDLP